MDESKKCCSTCKYGVLGLNHYYCNYHNDSKDRLALDSCDSWEKKDLVVHEENKPQKSALEKLEELSKVTPVRPSSHTDRDDYFKNNSLDDDDYDIPFYKFINDIPNMLKTFSDKWVGTFDTIENRREMNRELLSLQNIIQKKLDNYLSKMVCKLSLIPEYPEYIGDFKLECEVIIE